MLFYFLLIQVNDVICSSMLRIRFFCFGALGTAYYSCLLLLLGEKGSSVQLIVTICKLDDDH